MRAPLLVLAALSLIACDDDDDAVAKDSAVQQDTGALDSGADAGDTALPDAEVADAASPDASPDAAVPITCDAAGEDSCGDGFACLDVPEGDRCTPIVAPALLEGVAYGRDDRLALKLIGQDLGQDVVGFDLELQDESNTVLVGVSMDLTKEESVVGQTEFTIRTLVGGLSEFPAARQAKVSLRDAQALTSAPLTLLIGDQPAVQLGEACDYAGVDNYCPAQSRCEAGDDGRYTCVQLPIPLIQDLVPTYNPATNALGLRVTGLTGGEYPVDGFALQVFAADGTEIPYEALGGDGFEDFDHVETVGNTFEATFSGLLIDRFRGMAEVELMVVDQGGVTSEPMRLPVEAPPTVARGAACDPLTALNRCASEDVCVGMAATVCTEAQLECQAAWPTVDLNAHAEGAGWVYRGDTRALTAVTNGTCGGGARAEILRFVAPTAGTYVFETSSAEATADTVLYARRFCRYDAVDAELACSDDVDGGSLSRISLSLTEGQPVFLFVDAFTGGLEEPWAGTYALEGRKLD